MTDRRSDVNRRMMGAVEVVGRIPATGTGGTLPCPVCRTGTVTWARQGPRAMQVRCSTEDCVRMMA